MATQVLIAFSLCLLLCGVFSKPVAYDLASVQSTDSADTVGIKKDIKLGAVTVLSAQVDSEVVRSLDSDAVVVPSLTDGVKRDRRFKRESIRGSGCPSEYIFYMQRCMPFELYEEMLEE